MARAFYVGEEFDLADAFGASIVVVSSNLSVATVAGTVVTLIAEGDSAIAVYDQADNVKIDGFNIVGIEPTRPSTYKPHFTRKKLLSVAALSAFIRITKSIIPAPIETTTTTTTTAAVTTTTTTTEAPAQAAAVLTFNGPTWNQSNSRWLYDRIVNASLEEGDKIRSLKNNVISGSDLAITAQQALDDQYNYSGKYSVTPYAASMDWQAQVIRNSEVVASSNIVTIPSLGIPENQPSISKVAATYNGSTMQTTVSFEHNLIDTATPITITISTSINFTTTTATATELAQPPESPSSIVINQQLAPGTYYVKIQAQSAFGLVGSYPDRLTVV